MDEYSKKNMAKQAKEFITQGKGNIQEFIKLQWPNLETNEDAKKDCAEFMAYWNIPRYDNMEDFINQEYEALFTDKNVYKNMIPTGFNSLDSAINGGIINRLYTIGAITSLGKTTLILQIADNIAQAGYPVLIFSLEMDRTELLAKALSRISFQNEFNSKIKSTSDNKDILNAYDNAKRNSVYTSSILRGDNAKKKIIDKAKDVYYSYAKNIKIEVGYNDINLITQTIKDNTQKLGKPPVVILDYIQIAKSPENCFTDKQQTDAVISTLKNICSVNKNPVLAISSLSRATYYEPISFESFKESGNVEYSTDFLIGLQLSEIRTIKTNAQASIKKEIIQKALEQKPRNIDLNLLKNRGGARTTIYFKFFPDFNYFIECFNPITNNNSEEENKHGKRGVH